MTTFVEVLLCGDLTKTLSKIKEFGNNRTANTYCDVFVILHDVFVILHGRFIFSFSFLLQIRKTINSKRKTPFLTLYQHTKDTILSIILCIRTRINALST
uniref:Uncharacterized protein n=1 Tax=Cacopsylla melanoneura TaxID=428564 RepID=A0A8D8TED0_9HEMI